MTTVIMEPEVSRPDVIPLNSSILDHAKAAGNYKPDMARFGMRNNEGLYPSYNCLDLLTPTPACPDPSLTEEGEYKRFDTAPWVPGFQFALHGGVQCSPVGLDENDQKAEVKRVFEASEGKGIERALKAVRFVERTPDARTARNMTNQGAWDEPEDITPDEAVNLKQAIALLEGIAAARYVGVPTIHMPRAAVSMISDMVQWRDDNLAYTPAGSKIAVGGGYDDEAMLLSGVWDLYATGEVYVESSKEVLVQLGVQPGDGSSAATNGLVDNTTVALAERQYRVVVDCFVVRIRATIF